MSSQIKYEMRDGKLYKLIFTKYITVKGKRIVHPKGGVYCFWVEVV